MQMLKEEWFWAMIQAIAVIVTLALIYMQIRMQTSSHVVATLQAIHARWTEAPMLWARFNVCSAYLSEKFVFEGEGEYIAEFLEELGGYIKIKAVAPDIMWDAESWRIEHYYSMFISGIEKSRLTHADLMLYENTVLLYEAMVKQSEKKGAKGCQRGADALSIFAKCEVQITKPFLPPQELKKFT